LASQSAKAGAAGTVAPSQLPRRTWSPEVAAAEIGLRIPRGAKR
jgi:hypothetical protein